MKKNNIKMFVMILGVSFLPVSTVQAGELNPDFLGMCSSIIQYFVKIIIRGICVISMPLLILTRMEKMK